MMIKQKDFHVKELNYSIRSAVIEDAKTLSKLRVQIDGETENMEREGGEAFIEASGFEKIIQTYRESPRNLFLNVLETNDDAIELYKKHGFEIEGILKH